MMRAMKHTLALLAAFLAAPLLSHAQRPANPPAVPVRVALVSDTHCTRGTNEDQTLHRGRLDKVIAAVNAAQVDLVLVAGDLTENGWPEEVGDFKQQVRGFKAPVWWVPGNHDIGNKRMPNKKPDAHTVTAFRVARYEMRFGRSYFARERAGIRVIGINSSLFGSGFRRERRMWQFLEKELARPADRPTIVFMHHPPFLKKVDEPGGDYFNIEPGPRARLLALLKQGGVHTVLSGHVHKPLNLHAGDILLWTTPPVAFGLPRGKQPQGWTLVTVPARGEATTEFRPVAD